MDELRDYRYYDQDMVHTGSTANQYIWERFESALLSTEARSVNRELESLLKLREHRPRVRRGEAYEKLMRQMEEMHLSLQDRFPWLSWTNLDKK